MIELDNNFHTGAKIRAIGIGGCGCNAIDNLINTNLQGVDFIAANSDTQALAKNKAGIKIQVGKKTAKGLGVGGNPEIGKKCIEEDLEEVKEALTGSDMVFISAGMGGGTGTGGSAEIAKIAKEMGALVVAIVTKPFKVEGPTKNKYAETYLQELKKNVDSLIVVSNQKLLEVIPKDTPFSQATKKVDEVLMNATRGVIDVIFSSGYMNVDFADLKNTMQNKGDALIGIGMAKGENRAVEAVQNALYSPLLEGVSITGAKSILLNITGDDSVTFNEIETITNLVQESASEDTFIKFGVVNLPENTDSITVTIVATGFERESETTHTPAKDSIKQMETPAEKQEIEKPQAAAKRQEPTNNISKIDTAGSFRQPRPIPGGSTSGRVISYPGDFDMTPYREAAASPANVNMPPSTAPKGQKELRNYDDPAFSRKNTSDQTKPAFLRKVMD